MRQKVVIKVTMNDQKYRKKALKTVVGFDGVESTSVQGNDKDQIEVIGEGIDPVKITTLLRKKVGRSDIFSVSAVGEKEGAKPKGEGDAKKYEQNPKVPDPTVIWNPYPYHHVYEVRDSNSDPCTIM